MPHKSLKHSRGKVPSTKSNLSAKTLYNSSQYIIPYAWSPFDFEYTKIFRNKISPMIPKSPNLNYNSNDNNNDNNNNVFNQNSTQFTSIRKLIPIKYWCEQTLTCIFQSATTFTHTALHI